MAATRDFSLADLPDDADQFCANPLALHRVRAVLIFVENTLEGFGVARFICAVGLGHEPRAAFLIGRILGEVGMDALGSFAEQTV